MLTDIGRITIFPISLTINDVIASFEKDAKCPVLRIVFMPMDREVIGEGFDFTGSILQFRKLNGNCQSFYAGMPDLIERKAEHLGKSTASSKAR